MTIIDFAHPLTEGQRTAVENMTGLTIEKVLLVDTQIDTATPLEPQVRAWLDSVPLSPEEWQSESLLMVLPSLGYSVAVLLAELHGRMGHFPAIIRLRPALDSLVPRFDVAEIVNLQAVRETARISRATH